MTIAPDVDNYMIAYTSKYYNAKDLGFYAVIKFAQSIGLNFYAFKCLYLFVCILILFGALKLILPNVWSVIFLYLMFPFLLNVVQIRHFFVISVFLLAFAASMHIKSKKICWPLWSLLIFFAATQHKVAIVFLPFILFKEKDNLLPKIVIFMFVLSVLFQFVLQSNFSLLMQQGLFLFDESSRMNLYSERQSHYGVFLLMLESLGMIYIAQKVVELNRNLASVCVSDFFVQRNIDFPRYIRNLFLYGSFFWPLYIWGGSFARLKQCEMILLYVLIVFVVHVFFSIPEIVKKILGVNDSVAKIMIVFSVIFLLNCKVIWITLWDMLVMLIFDNLVFLFAYLT